MPLSGLRHSLATPVATVAALIERFGLAGFWVAAGRLSFLVLVATAGRLAPADVFGLFMVALAASQILSIFSTMGTGGAAQFFVARSLAKGHLGQIPAYVRFALAISLAGSVAVACLLCLAAYGARAWFGDAKLESICLAAAALTLVMAPSVLREMLARSLRAVTLALAPRDIVWTLSLALMLVVSPMVRENLVVVAIISLGAVEATAWSLLWYRHLRHFRGARPRRWRPYRKWMVRSLAMMGSNAGGVAFERVDTLTVGILASLPLAGAYGAVSRIAPLVSISNRFVVPIILPRIAALMATGDMQALRRETRHSVLVSLVSALPLYVALMLFAEEATALVGAPESVADVLRILATANLFTAMGSTYGALVQMDRLPWLFPVCMWGCLALTLVALPIAFAQFGVEGAAFAVALGMGSYSIIYCYFGTILLRRGSSLERRFR